MHLLFVKIETARSGLILDNIHIVLSQQDSFLFKLFINYRILYMLKQPILVIIHQNGVLTWRFNRISFIRGRSISHLQVSCACFKEHVISFGFLSIWLIPKLCGNNLISSTWLIILICSFLSFSYFIISNRSWNTRLLFNWNVSSENDSPLTH